MHEMTQVPPRYQPGTGKPSLFAKMAEIQGALSPVHADRTVNAGSYTFKYVTESQLLEAARGLLAERKIGVFVSVEDQQSEMVEVTGTRKDGASYTTMVERAQVTIAITFCDGESGEMFTILGQGRANDSADKAVYKAITSANRYAWWKTLLVPTDDDDVNQSRADYEYRGRGEQKPAARKGAMAFDPSQELLPGAIDVKGANDAASLRAAQRALLGSVDWDAEEVAAGEHAEGVVRSEWGEAHWGRQWRRIANAVVRAQENGGVGEFPPPSTAQVVKAFSWAFGGYVLNVPEATGSDSEQPGTAGNGNPAEPAEHAQGRTETHAAGKSA